MSPRCYRNHSQKLPVPGPWTTMWYLISCAPTATTVSPASIIGMSIILEPNPRLLLSDPLSGREVANLLLHPALKQVDVLDPRNVPSIGIHTTDGVQSACIHHTFISTIFPRVLECTGTETIYCTYDIRSLLTSTISSCQACHWFIR
jgi:hypothetical protein